MNNVNKMDLKKNDFLRDSIFLPLSLFPPSPPPLFPFSPLPLFPDLPSVSPQFHLIHNVNNMNKGKVSRIALRTVSNFEQLWATLGNFWQFLAPFGHF